MKSLARHSINSVEGKLRGEKSVFGFEIFGYDFLIDGQGKVWLIEVNTNPCLEFAGSLLSRIIWHMVDNSMRIAIDPLLDQEARKEYQSYLDMNKYELII
jgi:tubulin--tyrosine ligase